MDYPTEQQMKAFMEVACQTFVHAWERANEKDYMLVKWLKKHTTPSLSHKNGVIEIRFPPKFDKKTLTYEPYYEAICKLFEPPKKRKPKRHGKN